MRKISSSNTNSLFLKLGLKSIILTLISVALFTALFSILAYKVDIDIGVLQYFSYAVIILSAITVSYFSVKSFKNNGFALGILSTVPLAIFSFINFISNNNNAVHFLIKLLLLLLFSGIFGYISTKKSTKFKVK